MPGDTTQRGYGYTHQQERRRWRTQVDTGRITCWRCHKPILPGTHWDLGHDDHDRTRYRGPEHRACNRAAGARKGNSRRGTKRTISLVTRLRW